MLRPEDVLPAARTPAPPAWLSEVEGRAYLGGGQPFASMAPQLVLVGDPAAPRVVDARDWWGVAASEDRGVLAAVIEAEDANPTDDFDIAVYAPPVYEPTARFAHRGASIVAVSPDGRWIAAGGGGAVRRYDRTGALQAEHVLVPLAQQDLTTSGVWYTQTQALLVRNDGTMVFAMCNRTAWVVAPNGRAHRLRLPWPEARVDEAEAHCVGEVDEDGRRTCNWQPPHDHAPVRLLARGRRVLLVTHDGTVVEWRRLGPRARSRLVVEGGCTDAEVHQLVGDLTGLDLQAEAEMCGSTAGAHLAEDGRHLVLQPVLYAARRIDLRTGRRVVERIPESATIVAPADAGAETLWMMDRDRPRRWSLADDDWIERDVLEEVTASSSPGRRSD